MQIKWAFTVAAKKKSASVTDVELPKSAINSRRFMEDQAAKKCMTSLAQQPRATGKQASFPTSGTSLPAIKGSASDVVIDGSTRVATLPYQFLEAASLLQVGSPALHRGWERFAGELDFDIESISAFRRHESPVKAIITEWQSKSAATFGKFLDVMKRMDRHDVIVSMQAKLGSQMSPKLLNQIKSLARRMRPCHF